MNFKYLINRQGLIFCLLLSVIAFDGCSSNSTGPIDDGDDHNKPSKSIVYVLNAGNFQDHNGSITRYNPKTKKVTLDVFKSVNNRPLAGLIQSSTVIGDSLYIVVNSTDRVEVVNLHTFASVGTIQISQTPAFIVPAGNGKAYVTNLYDSSVSVVNLKKREETSATIPVGPFPYFAYYTDGKVFVSNEGSSGSNNTISVIDIKTGAVVKTLTVGMGPNQIVEAPSGRLWVVCQGKVAYDKDFNRVPKNDIPGSIYIIDPQQVAVVDSIKTGGWPQQLVFDAKDSRAYTIFAGDDVAKINMNTLQVVDSSFIDRTFSAIGYSSEQHLLYLAKSRGYAQPGKVILYNLQGAAVDSFKAGIVPVGFEFVEK